MFRIFKRSQDGIAYLEFAIALPFLLALFLGAVEVTRYIIIAQKVEKATVTVSDVVAQSNSITTDQLDQLVEAASQIMLPYTFQDKGYVIISSVTKDGSSPPFVNWQYAGGGTWVQSSQVGSAGTTALWVPFDLEDKENIIIAEVFYNYSPILDNGLIDIDMIYKVATFKPRLGTLGSLGS